MSLHRHDLNIQYYIACILFYNNYKTNYCLLFKYSIFCVVATGIPDSPVTCEVHNTTSHGVLLMCVPGFSGGESCWYPVLQNRLDENPSVASASHEEISPYQILIKVDGLEGNTSYSLRIYSENVHGRSSGSVNVFTRTAGKQHQQIPSKRGTLTHTLSQC